MAFVHRQSCEGVKSELDLFYRTPHSELHHRQSRGGTSTHGLSGLWRTDRILHPRIGRRLPGSRQHDATRAGEGDASQRKRSRRGRARRTGEQLAAFAVESSRRLPERYARDLFVQHVRVSSLHRDAAALLSYGPDAKSTQLTNQLWYKDTSSRMNTVEIAAGPAS